MNPRIAAALWLVAALSSPCAVLAQDTFQAEAGLSYSRFKSDNLRTNQAGANATYYFDKLPTRPDYPFEQAQFAERTASLGANYAWTSSDISGLDKVSDGSIYGASAIFARPGSPFIATAAYSSLKGGKFRTPGTSQETESDARLYQVSAGLYVARTTDVLLTWARGTSDSKSTGSATQTSTSTLVGISGEHLMRLPMGDYFAFTAGVFQDTREQQNAPSEKNHDYVFQATYYPTHMLGITAGVQLNRGDDNLAEGETYSAGVRMFFTPAFSTSLDYRHFAAKATNNDDDRIALRAALRF
ncbi:MAG TPA: putative porin [Burkholderiales bacterium]|nr:putative porin [Burkholderiales bacterium]